MERTEVVQAIDELQSFETRLRYRVSNYWNRRWEYPFLMAASQSASFGLALDAGCGKSVLPFWLAHRGNRVIALDIDDGSFYSRGEVGDFYHSRSAAHNGELSFVEGSLYSIPFPDETFDAVFSVSVLEHLEMPTAAIGELVRVLRPGGLVVVTIDVSLDDRRQMTLENLDSCICSLEGAGSPLFPRIDVPDNDLMTTDWYLLHEPSALPWRLRKRSWSERIGAILSGHPDQAGPSQGTFFSMGVVGLAYLKTSD
jgi:SAM-dependent methyltransferase